MPFTLAHPIAVVPLARNRFLPFSALVIGSMTPDFSHILIGSWRHYRTAHSVSGAFTLDLPVGIATFVVFHAFLKLPILSLLPARDAEALYTIAQFRWPLRLRTAVAVVTALLIGTLTHIGMDNFTHGYGYFVHCIPALGDQEPLSGVPVFKLLQYGISVLGVVALAIAYTRRRSGQQRAEQPIEQFLRPTPSRRAKSLALLGLLALALLVSVIFATCNRHGLRSHLAPRKVVSDIICGVMAWISASAVTYATAWNWYHRLRLRTDMSRN